MRELKVGEDVLAPDGSRLGEVEGIVVDEAAHRVTHLVVAGRLVGLGKLRDAGPDGLAATIDHDQLEAQPPADTGQVTAPGPHWLAPAERRIGDFLAIAEALVGQSPYTPPVHVDFEAEPERELTRGSPVWAGGEHLGEVSRIVTDDGGRINSIGVRRHGPLGGDMEVPIDRVLEVVGNNVHLRPQGTEGTQVPPVGPPS